MELPVPALEESRAGEANFAGVRDYWLGGTNHTDADRVFAEKAVVCAPQLPYVVRRHRAFLRRMVHYLVDAGVRQFLDLGSGLPTVGNVHECAQEVTSECRVVYVDDDGEIAEEGRKLLADTPHAAFACADLRVPEQVLTSTEVRSLLDLGEPVAVLAIDVLHHIADSDCPTAFVREYADSMCSGSYLGLSHMRWSEGLFAATILFDRMYGGLPALTFRDAARFTDFFTGLELVEPGVVPIPLWRPELGEKVDRNQEEFPVYGAMGRKP